MIRVLEKQVADKIAAGEVIERPLSIVKELVENALDAGSTSITVEIREGGKSYIRVTDDGCGIDAADVETAFLRHATSKIQTAEDLNAIETLGFRGEALASIAAVSRTELLTKPATQEAGMQVILHGGEVLEKRKIGCPEGTTLIITDLFYNTPARAKFLKSGSAEGGRIIDYLSDAAISHPKVRFRMVSGERTVFSTTGRGHVQAAILAIYQEKALADLVPVSGDGQGLHLHGYISGPSLSRTNRRSQHFFVNGRVVKSQVLTRGLENGYRERLFEGRHPIGFLFLEVDPATLDVNIHPNKMEVRFQEESKIEEAISAWVRQALATGEAVPKVAAPKEHYVATPQGSLAMASVKVENIPTFKPVTKQVDINSILSTKREASSQEMAEEPVPSVQKPFDFLGLRFLDVAFQTYLLCEDEDHLYLVDQHAAHERIFYEALMNSFQSADKDRQMLLVPFPIDVPLSMEEDQTWMEHLLPMGFRLEPFGPSTFRILEIPVFMDLGEAERFLQEFVDGWQEEGLRPGNRPLIDRIIMRSCKSAIKGGDAISRAEAESLLAQLKACQNPFSCPHGRPTFIRYSRYEIERMFRRA